MKPHDVIVVGGGVIGLTTAYFLAKEGARVVICEQGKAGMESSWAGAGIIPPSDPDHAQLPLDRLRAMSSKLFPALSQELKGRTGIDNGYVRCGGLEFAGDTVPAAGDEWFGLGVTTNRLTEKDVARLEPNASPHLGPAIEIPGMAQLRNPRHLQAVKAACLATGTIDLREETPARSLVLHGNRAQGIRLGDEVLSGGSVLLAAGAWTDRLLEPLGIRLRIEPVRGQIALLNPGAMLFRRIFLCGARYLVPRLDGRVLIGSTEEHVGFDKATTAEGIRGLLDFGVRMVPRLAAAALERTWAGLRPGSPDGLPFLGRVPAIENLYVASGHFRAGIQLSPGTALMLKELILGQSATMPADAFRLDR
ncbi:MAG: FAD-dependent oxidoreductase [Planctomycetes bacterium]|nr:FAD-dependent oxidoreductase [Planctomycetota bacterium]